MGAGFVFCKINDGGIERAPVGMEPHVGIAKAQTEILLRENLRRKLEGDVLQLGRQAIFLSEADMQALARKVGTTLNRSGAAELSWDKGLASRGFLSDKSFFRLLGFSKCEALDYSDFEGADHIFDLNAEEVPPHLRNRYDFIVDGGTIEHVFHLPNTLRNIFSMLKVGGRILHISPSSNHIDHGFYMFSPTFFADYYATNKFEIDLAQVARYTPRHDVDPWLSSNYTPGCLDPVSFGGLDDAMYTVIFLATKTAESTAGVVPQQGFYNRIYGKPESFKVAAAAPLAARKSAAKRLKTLITKLPGFPLANAVRLKLMGKTQEAAPAKGLGLPVDAELGNHG